MKARYMRQHSTAALLVASLISPLTAQITTEILTVQDPRPLSAIGAAIEVRTGVPINYEDARYEHEADLQDVTDTIMSPEQKAQARPGVRVIVPKGGTLTTSLSTDPAGPFPDFLSASTALNAALQAYHGSGAFSAKFAVSTRNGALFIKPTQIRDAAGENRDSTPVLDTAVTLEHRTRRGIETLDLLAKVLSTASGYRVEVGTVPLRAMIESQVTMGAEKEAAVSVLTRLLGSVAEASGGKSDKPALSYAVFFDVKQRFYAINIHWVTNPNRSIHSIHSLPVSVPASAEGVYFKKTPNQ